MAFASQWTFTKRHTDTTAVGFTELHYWRFLLLKIQAFCTYFFEKGATSCSSLNMPSLHPSSFTRVLLTVTCRRTNVHFLLRLTEIPWFHHAQPAVTARIWHRKPRSSFVNDSLRTTSCLGNYKKHFNSFKQDLQAAMHVHTRRTHVFIMKPGGDR